MPMIILGQFLQRSDEEQLPEVANIQPRQNKNLLHDLPKLTECSFVCYCVMARNYINSHARNLRGILETTEYGLLQSLQ